MCERRSIVRGIIGVLLCLAMASSAGCDPPPDNVTTFEPSNGGGRRFVVLVIDGCDYVANDFEPGARWLVHKGNCRACREWAIKAIHAKPEAAEQGGLK
jgi:hypothetical protein